jgi:acetyl-CoA carboxylase beta subunit
MDFAFIGGSMGRCWGEKFQRNQSFNQNNIPFIMISKSGGANDGSSLFFDAVSQTSVNLPSLLRPKYTLCTDNTGGTTASYAMLGDINIF